MGNKSIRGLACAFIAATFLLAAPTANAVPHEFFGLSAESPETVEFEAMAAAGFGSFRVPVNWRSVQSSRDGGYEWAATDRQIAAAEDAGLRPVLLVFNSPPFVHVPPPEGSRGTYPPIRRADLAQWRDFTSALARRYGPSGRFDNDPANPDFRPVRTWVIWNEQNTVAYWLPQPSPSQYARVLKYAHTGITSVDPDAEIVLGGMYGYPIAHTSIKSFAYLRRLYRVRGVKRLFDAVNVHPYGTNVGMAIDQIERFRTVMHRAHDFRTPMLIGEIGWPSNDGQAKQARRIGTFLGRVLAHRHQWRIDGVMIYVWRDNPAVDTCLFCYHSGLVSSDGSPKRALGKVAAIIANATAKR